MTINNNFKENVSKRTQEETESSQLNKKSKNESSQETAYRVNEVVQEENIFTAASPHGARSSSIPSALHNTSNDEEDNSYSLQLTSSPLYQGSPNKEETDSDQESQLALEQEIQERERGNRLNIFFSRYLQSNPVFTQDSEQNLPINHAPLKQSEGSGEERSPYPIRNFSPNQLLVNDPIEDESMEYIKGKIANCFIDDYDKESILNANHLERLISVISYNFFDYKNTRVITDTFIENIYQSLLLLQNREGGDIFQKSEAFAAIKDLYHSLMLLRNYPTFEAIKEGRFLHEKENPNIYLTPIREQLKKPLGALYRQIINGAPLYTMKDWTGQDGQFPSYILGNRKDIYPWIFKPEWASPNLFETKKSTLYASAMNFHRGFPILDTFLIRTKNITGQLDHVILKAEPLSIFVERSIFSSEFRKSLQALLIFDILFCNANRSFNDILTINLEVIYGINHEECFKVPKEFKIDYWWLAGYENDRPLHFDIETLELISIENCQRYQQILRSFSLNPNLSSWVDSIGSLLRSTGREKTIPDLIEEIEKKFYEEFFSSREG
ncbi:hypothetical protein [Rhabdochlamydiaceae symbiont of Dictyostelium giganteum]|uniref:hypothetical protein n=1 Tax=Rhabdochlamydiaceae symbiont of Dictyostelium giganteum TaxID=3342349 RepID=UPI00384A58B5